MLKGVSVPVFKLNEQFLLQHIDLLLCIVVVLLAPLQITEHVTVLFFHIFHFSKHHELLFIDDILGFVAKLVVVSDLLLLEALAAFVLLTIELVL